MTLKCKWCHKEVRISGSSKSNPRVHRDGSSQAGKNSSGCPRRNQAINSGAKIPPTQAEIKASKIRSQHAASMDNFLLPVPEFDNLVVNQMISLWQVTSSLPWTIIEHPMLRTILMYLQPGIQVYKRKWSAEEAKRLYVGLRESVVKELKVSSHRFHYVLFNMLTYLLQSHPVSHQYVHLDSRCMDCFTQSTCVYWSVDSLC